MGGFSGSYLSSDVTFLLTQMDFEYTDIKTKERLIQSGKKHYSEMLSAEYVPSEEYLATFYEALQQSILPLAEDVLQLAYSMNQQKHLVLVSLVRAGTPIGVLLKRTLALVFKRNVAHYAISIIRDRGIDEVALDYIRAAHLSDGSDIRFIDGWTGKGVIAKQLWQSVEQYNKQHDSALNAHLSVLSDICGAAKYAARRSDYLIPSSLLNSTISGLVSRSILNESIGKTEFHGCKFHQEFIEKDLSLWYINTIMEKVMQLGLPIKGIDVDENKRLQQRKQHERFIEQTLNKYQISNINLLKPGIGEAIRVLLRRYPEKILMRDKSKAEMQAFLRLAAEKGVPVVEELDMPYQVMSMIRTVKG